MKQKITFAAKATGDGIRPLKERRTKRRSSFFSSCPTLRFHPLFLIVGVWYAFTGELFLFLLSAIVALQHECAHAFAAAKLGYKLHAIVLTPFGAVIDGDLQGISLKDEVFVAFCGPLCNLVTALFFGALWWFAPVTYAFTDTAFYSSVSIALVNLLPAYPLDGGRILRCSLSRAFAKNTPDQATAEKRAERLCFILTLLFAFSFLVIFLLQCVYARGNISALAFGLFLLVGAFGNREKSAVYEKMDFSLAQPMRKGVTLRRVAILGSCPIKDAFRFLARGSYLVLEVYDEQERWLFDLSQNELSSLFAIATTPYDTLFTLWKRREREEKR